jgi:dTMP kinase
MVVRRDEPRPALGPFITFEGIEGCGKSTQIARLCAHLARQHRPHLATREPGGTPVGDALRQILLTPEGEVLDGLTELFLLEAARRSHVQRVIVPARRQGHIVISDRFADSSIAYQGAGRGLGVVLVERLNALATDGLEPDLTLLLDLPVEIGLGRVAHRARGEDRMEREVVAFHQRVRQGYLELARRRADRYATIDACLPEEEIFARVLERLRPLLATGGPVSDSR